MGGSEMNFGGGADSLVAESGEEKSVMEGF